MRRRWLFEWAIRTRSSAWAHTGQRLMIRRRAKKYGESATVTVFLTFRVRFTVTVLYTLQLAFRNHPCWPCVPMAQTTSRRRTLYGTCAEAHPTRRHLFLSAMNFIS